MSKVKNKDTRPEMIVRKFLFSKGFRYRLNVSKLPGRPDIVLPKYKTVVFVNGCFWHGHNCRFAKLPETNKKFWSDKINGNIIRDKQKLIEIQRLGWRTIVIWQCELKPAQRTTTLENLANEIKNAQENHP